MKKLKAFWGSDGRDRMLVIATSQKRAVELLSEFWRGGVVSLNYFRNYWSQCDNDTSDRLATEGEGVWKWDGATRTGEPTKMMARKET